MRPLALLLWSFCLPLAAWAQSPPLPAPAVAHEFAAGALPEARTVWVALPAGYDAAGDTRYDTLYVLDARGTLPLAVADAGLLAMAGEAPGLIVVGIDSLTPADRFRNFTPVPDPAGRHAGSGGADAFLKFVEDEVVPDIERNYRTSGKRMIAGHSLAGLWVLHAAMERPNLFDAYAAISPTMGWADQHLIGRLRDEAKKDRRFPAFVFVTMADDAPAYAEAYLALQALVNASPRLRSNWTLRRFRGETHVSTVAPALHAALRWRYPRTAAP